MRKQRSAFRPHFAVALAAFSIVGSLLSAGNKIRYLSDSADGLSSPVLSPDGTKLAYASSRGIDVRPVAGGTAVAFAIWQDESGVPHSPRWSPDGGRIAFLRFLCNQCQQTLFIKNSPDGIEKPMGTVCEGVPSWTPNGRFLIATETVGEDAVGDPCRLVLIPLDGGERVVLANEGDELSLTRDGKRLAYAAGNTLKTVHLDVNYQFSDTPLVIAREPHAISSIYWSADGHTLLYQVYDYIKAVTDGVARVVDPGAQIQISQVLPDGGLLGAETRGLTSLWRMDLTGSQLQPERVLSIPWADSDLSVSADGKWLAFATIRNGATQIWTSHLDGSEARVLLAAIPPFDAYGDKTALDGVSWSPDGNWIAIATQPGVGHGDTQGRIFVIPSSGGRLRKVADHGWTGAVPIWTENSKAVYAYQLSDDYKENSYFLADIATGHLTSIAEGKVPKLPSVPLPQSAQHPHTSQGGRFLYYEDPPDWKSRLVRVEGVLPR